MREITVGESVQRAELMRAVATDASLSPEEKRANMRELAACPVVAPNVPVGGQRVQTGAPSAAVATADALAKLADLRDRGVLTHGEFHERRHRLLGERRRAWHR
jgi:hypothetical protein